MPVLWLEAGQPPLETVTTALAERRRQGQPVKTLHWVSHGSPGVLHVAEQRIDQGALLTRQELIAEWSIHDLVLWSCNAGEKEDFISLWEELTGATIWSSRQPLGRLSTGDTNWPLNTSSDKSNLANQFQLQAKQDLRTSSALVTAPRFSPLARRPKPRQPYPPQTQTCRPATSPMQHGTTRKGSK